MGIKNQRTVYECVSILINQQVYEWVYFFIDQVYDWGRFQKFGPHTYHNYPLVTLSTADTAQVICAFVFA